jgi:DNA-binding LacI/PurR family transcriptional regulator
MTTVRAIAQRAHVSIATVSRVLNNHPRVSEDTRLVVLQAAQELGYPMEKLRNTPQVFRSVLVLTREESWQNTPGTQYAGGEFERRVWVGVNSALEEKGIATRLQRSNVSVEEAEQHALDIGVSGLVLLGGVRDRDFVEALQNQDIPFVIAGAHLHPLEINCVMADVAQGIKQVIEHLVAQRRRRIGFVNGPETTTTSAEKLDAYRLALCTHGLDFGPQQLLVSDFSPESGYQQTRDLLKRCPDLDAVIYADDSIAFGGIRAIKEQGHRIPDDIAVTGFGDYELAQFTDPPLTTVRFDMYQMGVIAAQRLCMLFDNPDEFPWLIRVPTSLVVRQSTGPNIRG